MLFVTEVAQGLSWMGWGVSTPRSALLGTVLKAWAGLAAATARSGGLPKRGLEKFRKEALLGARRLRSFLRRVTWVHPKEGNLRRDAQDRI